MSGRGILSLHIYVIVAKALRLTSQVVFSQGWIQSFHIENSNIEISHLQYVDDAISFLNVDEEVISKEKGR